MTSVIAPMPRLWFGPAFAGYKLFNYAAGTATKQNTYTDSTGIIPNTNPIILDANGSCSCYFTPAILYKQVLALPADTDPPTSPIWTQDNLTGSSSAQVSLLDFGGDPTGVNDSSTALRNAVAQCKTTGAVLSVPPGNYTINTDTGSIILEYVTIQGSMSLNDTSSPASTGSVFSITGTTNPPFLMRRGVVFDGIGFFYPAQVDSATPMVFPPTIQVDVSDGAVQFCYIQNCVVFNAYRFLVDTDATGGIGHCFILDNTIYGVLTCFELQYNVEIITIQGNEFTFGHYLAATEAGLRSYTRANGSVFKIAQSDGLIVQGNVFFGYQYGINCPTVTTGGNGGLIQLTDICDNYFDQCRYGINISGTGNVSGFMVSGNSFISFNSQSHSVIGNAINISTSGSVATEQITVSGNSFSTCTGDQVNVSGNTPSRQYTFTANTFTSWAQFSSSTQYAALNLSGSSTSYTVTGNTFFAQNSNYQNGIVGSAADAVISGNLFGQCNLPLNLTLNSVITVGNQSFGTGGTASDNYSGGGAVYSVANLWDKASGTTTRPAMTVRKNAAQTFAASSSNVAATFPSVSFDKAGNWNTSTSTWTAKQAGRYRFTWLLMHDNTATAGERWTFVISPSSGVASTYSYLTVANYNTFGTAIELDLPNAATVQLLVSQVAGTHNLVTFNDQSSNYLSVSLVE